MLLHEGSLLLVAGLLSLLLDERLRAKRRMSSPHVVVFFCLLTCCGFTSGLRHGVLTVLAQAGSDVILPCSLGNKDIQSQVFDWKKDGVMEVFLYSGGDEYNNGRAGQSEQFRGRVSHFEDELKHGNASIIITNTKMADSGNYTCVFPRLQTGSQTQHVQLVVGVVRKVVEDGSDVILPCSLSNKQDITAAVFHWKKVAQRGQRQKEVFFYDAGIHHNNGRTGQSEEFRGRVSHFGDQLKHGNASIIITNTKMADSGNYSCAFPLLQTPQTFYMELVVEFFFKDRSGGSSGAAPEPFIRTLDASEDWSRLQCEVRRASPRPAVEWQDGDGNTLPAEEPQVSETGGSYDVTLNITVKKTGRYRCVVEQEDLKHRVAADAFVHVCETVCRDWIGWLAGFVLGGFVVLAVQALLVHMKCITIRCNNGRQQQENALDDGQSSSC